MISWMTLNSISVEKLFRRKLLSSLLDPLTFHNFHMQEISQTNRIYVIFA